MRYDKIIEYSVLKAFHLISKRTYREKVLRYIFPSNHCKEKNCPPENKNILEAEAPSEEAWQDISHEVVSSDEVIDILLPVYKGYAETARCLYSVLKSENAHHFEIVVVDDHTPDAEISELLDRLSARGLITLIRNTENQGFVLSMNKAMAVHPQRDVVWLNSDTEVFSDWLDRILEQASSDKKIATITPLSNNATICSYPWTCFQNRAKLAHSDRLIDRIAAVACRNMCVEVPTGVGFCMYVRRSALKEVGILDAETFGKGYGEENDLCQRFIRHGYINIAQPSVFVRHYGAVSFGSKASGNKKNHKALVRRYPKYDADVAEWIRMDPLRPARVFLDAALYSQEYPNTRILHLVHDWGGGTEKFVNDLCTYTEKLGIGCCRLRPDSKDYVELLVNDDYPNIARFNIHHEGELLKKCLQKMGITHIHLHSIVSFNPFFSEYLESWAREGVFKITVTIHDYHWCCPRINMVDKTGKVCESVDIERCNRCGIECNTESFMLLYMRHRRLLSSVYRITVPSRDVKRRIEKIYPSLSCIVVPHADSFMVRQPLNRTGVSTKRVVVACIGSLSEIKGLSVLLDVAKEATKRHLPLDFVLIGYERGNNKEELKRVGIRVSGRYKNESEAVTLLKHFHVGLVWFPAIWNETFSYTLSIALQSGLPACSFDLGAQAERLRDAGMGDFVMPLSLKDDVPSLADKLVELSRKNYRCNYRPREMDLSAYYPDLNLKNI